MASVILLRRVPVEHVTLAGNSVSSRRTVPRQLVSETARPAVREQVRVMPLPDCVLSWRMPRASAVLP
jgi:hypothetical protein